MADRVRIIGYPITLLCALAAAVVLSLTGGNACTGPQDEGSGGASALSVPLEQAQLDAELHVNGIAIDLTEGSAATAALQAQLVALVDDLPADAPLDAVRERLASVELTAHIDGTVTVLVGGVPVRGSVRLHSGEASELCVEVPPLPRRCSLAAW